MHSRKLTVTEIVRNFPDYINRIIYKRERFILLKGKKPVAELKPIPSGFSLGELNKVLLSLPRLTKDEAEDFLKDVNDAREGSKEMVLKNPWESCKIVIS